MLLGGGRDFKIPNSFGNKHGTVSTSAMKLHSQKTKEWGEASFQSCTFNPIYAGRQI